MKQTLALLLISLVSILAQDWGYSGYVGDDLYNTYGGPSSMAFDASGTLWVLYANKNATNPAFLQSYVLSGGRSSPDFPLNNPTVPLFNFPKGNSWVVPLDVTNQTTVLRGLTFNAANNFVLLGERPDPEDNFGVVDYWDTTCDGALWVLNERAEFILGPMEAIFPLTCQVNGITYVPGSDSYFITDPSCGMLSESIITCCREIEPPHPPQNRWLQQVLLRRGVGLQYGLRGDLNIFARGVTGYSTVAAPGLGSPQDVTYDPQTGHLWVVNNFPTTTVLELTTDYVVVNHYNLESITGGLKDARAVAVNNDYLLVGFYNEGYIAVFDKPSPLRNNGRELEPARYHSFEEQKALEAKAKVEAAQLAATQKAASKNVPEKAAEKTNKKEKGHKSHFH